MDKESYKKLTSKIIPKENKVKKYALGAIRTRDLSLKRGVLYLLSYKRKLSNAIHFVSKIILARTNFNVNRFIKKNYDLVKDRNF